MPSTINYYNRNRKHRLEYQKVYRILEKLNVLPDNKTKLIKDINTQLKEPKYSKENKNVVIYFD